MVATVGGNRKLISVVWFADYQRNSRWYHGISTILVAMTPRIHCYFPIFNSSAKGCALYGAYNPHRTSPSYNPHRTSSSYNPHRTSSSA